MKEAIGNTFLFYGVIIFSFIFIALFVGFTSYTKAFKVKNRIISIIEKNNENPNAVSDSGNITQKVKKEIEDNLQTVGYRIKPIGERNSCVNYFQKHYSLDNYVVANIDGGNYDYCIARFTTPKGNYYAVIAYMYFDTPLLGTKVSIPVFGETKVMGILN